MTPRMNDRQVNGYYQVKSREYRKKYFLKFFKTFIPTHFFAIHLRAKRIRPELGNWKQVKIVALWKKTIIAFQILPKGTTVDYSVYLDFLQHRLLPEVKKKKFGRPIILHDNAKPHKHRVVREWLMAKIWEELEHPPYSPHISPRTWTLYTGLKLLTRASCSKLRMNSSMTTARQLWILMKNTNPKESICCQTDGVPYLLRVKNMLNNYVNKL